MTANLLAVIEWVSAVLLGLSIFWYPAKDGWRRIAAPCLGILGCAGFFVVASVGGLWGIATLNGGLALVNLWNFFGAVKDTPA